MHSETPAPADAETETVVAHAAEVVTPVDAAEAPPIDAAERVAEKPPIAMPITASDRHPPPRHEAERPSGPPGFITIDSAPVYAVIYIDGKKFGETPLVHITLPAGRHTVKAVSPSGTTKSVSIAIESGKTAPVRRIEW